MKNPERRKNGKEKIRRKGREIIWESGRCSVTDTVGQLAGKEVWGEEEIGERKHKKKK